MAARGNGGGFVVETSTLEVVATFTDSVEQQHAPVAFEVNEGDT